MLAHRAFEIFIDCPCFWLWDVFASIQGYSAFACRSSESCALSYGRATG